jgi:hypothetical protein
LYKSGGFLSQSYILKELRASHAERSKIIQQTQVGRRKFSRKLKHKLIKHLNIN